MTFGVPGSTTPLPGFRFVVTFTLSPSAGAIVAGSGIVPVQAGFSEVSGLAGSIEMHTYNEGGRNDRVHKFATRADYGNITFRRGMALGRELFDWYDQVRRGSFGARRSILIAHLDDAGAPAQVWYVFRALPTSYVGPTWDAGQNSLAIEALEIAHEGIELVPGSDVAIEGAQGG